MKSKILYLIGIIFFNLLLLLISLSVFSEFAAVKLEMAPMSEPIIISLIFFGIVTLFLFKYRKDTNSINNILKVDE